MFSFSGGVLHGKSADFPAKNVRCRCILCYVIKPRDTSPELWRMLRRQRPTHDFRGPFCYTECTRNLYSEFSHEASIGSEWKFHYAQEKKTWKSNAEIEEDGGNLFLYFPRSLSALPKTTPVIGNAFICRLQMLLEFC